MYVWEVIVTFHLPITIAANRAHRAIYGAQSKRQIDGREHISVKKKNILN